MRLDIEEGSVLILKELRTLVGLLKIKISYLTLLTFQMYLTQIFCRSKEEISPYAAEECKCTGDLPQSNQHWEFAAKQQCDTMLITVNCVKYMYIFVNYTLYVVKSCTV